MPAHQTEREIALVVLWALEAVEGGELHPHEAGGVFAGLDAGSAEREGPELSEDAAQLVVEAIHLHHGLAKWPGVTAAELRADAIAIVIAP